MDITFYSPSDYEALKALYEEAGWFDPVTDSEERLTAQIKNNPKSILLVKENSELVGTVTLLFTGRLGVFFRLITKNSEDEAKIQSFLLKEGGKIFRENGYSEAQILAPEGDSERQKAYEEYGFKKGKVYRWFWKNLG